MSRSFQSKHHLVMYRKSLLANMKGVSFLTQSCYSFLYKCLLIVLIVCFSQKRRMQLIFVLCRVNRTHKPTQFLYPLPSTQIFQFKTKCYLCCSRGHDKHVQKTLKNVPSLKSETSQDSIKNMDLNQVVSETPDCNNSMSYVVRWLLERVPAQVKVFFI